MVFRVFVLAGVCAGVMVAAPKLDYGRDVRPILAENCFHCHGQDSQKRMAGLRLDTAEGAAKALVPGKAEASLLYQRITAGNKARLMPPAASNRALTAEQIATLKQWIDEGGTYARHWAFEPPRRVEVPRGTEPIAHFVKQRLAGQGIGLGREASPEAWLRRVTLDLTGLPATPAELDAFTKKPDYPKAVDRLLASPRYGERMAMDWLDVARYADTHGFNNDSAREMWRWRDWVIEAFNRNLPYDRFLTEQLAGDLLPNPTLDQRIATGFGRNHVINSEGGIIEEEYRVEYVADRVRTLGMAWLGLTLECARCHDHKYDAITQRDHYRFFAFFNNVSELGEDGRVANASPLMPAPTKEQQAALVRLRASRDAARARMEARERGWRGKAELTADRPNAPAGADLTLGCEAASKEWATEPGVLGSACRISAGAKPETKAVPIGTRTPLTIAAWVRPETTDTDAALFSTMDYARSMASVRYGAGMELRLSNGELEFRRGQRFPAYAMRVRSAGARIQGREWRHVALIYSGDAADRNAMRAPASWVRMFIDGEEVPVQVLNDGAPVGARDEKPSPTRFRMGWDNRPDGPAYRGLMDEVRFYNRALAQEEMDALLGASPSGAWLRRAALARGDAKFADAYREWRSVNAAVLALERQSPTLMVMDELPTPRETHVLKRGAYDMPGERVDPGVPEQLLGPWPEGAPRNRLGLARWLTQPNHPLTARVVVNRFWQQLFGTGLVKTSENFGVQGESPSHPELLDWLAREFIDSGWDVKALLKRIVLSEVYRQDSAASKELLAKDPENRLLARGPRVRLPAESIRDQALTFAGLLSERVGGPSVYPYQPADLYKGIVVAADYPGTQWPPSTGADLYRRSLYTFWKRTVPHPTMTVFDAPDREFCIVRRSVTNTPLQALTLLNDPIFVEAARKFAERAIQEGGPSPESRLAWAFRMATGRAAEPADLAILRRTFDRALALYRADEPGARKLLQVGAAPVTGDLDLAELAAYTAVANVILNLDETITKG